jgi:hypothetical protein
VNRIGRRIVFAILLIVVLAIIWLFFTLPSLP